MGICVQTQIVRGESLTSPFLLVILLVMNLFAFTQVSLAEAKSRLSEVIDSVEEEHGRVLITRHGKPAAVLISPEDLQAQEETLDLLSDSEAMASLRRADTDVVEGRVEYLSKEEAQARWTHG